MVMVIRLRYTLSYISYYTYNRDISLLFNYGHLPYSAHSEKGTNMYYLMGWVTFPSLFICYYAYGVKLTQCSHHLEIKERMTNPLKIQKFDILPSKEKVYKVYESLFKFFCSLIVNQEFSQTFESYILVIFAIFSPKLSFYLKIL